MQSVNIGIDLGTTYSVIAVKGQVELADSWAPAMYLPECDVSILPSRDGDYTFPSVLWIDPNDPENVVVGMKAKQMANEGAIPIMFSKRNIGTNQKLKSTGTNYSLGIQEHELTAKECAVRFLKFLKSNAEDALGKRVYRAVVTHPAYFTPIQIKETREAAVEAGFEMSHDGQMMEEPVAAALAYTRENLEDSLLVLVYDLGGGTFDVTVLRKQDGVTKPVAHEGDHLLGGYDFDNELVEWILKRIAAKGRKIVHDENNPDHRARRTRLLQLAETVKEDLSRQKPQHYVTIKAEDILIDEAGNKVPILERINRKEYAELIAHHLEKTVVCSCMALAQARLIPDLTEETIEYCREAVKGVGVDRILMVGGSTQGPWVSELIGDVFGREVEPYNPDLCVAVGAALRAAAYDPPELGGEFVIDLDVSPRSAFEEVAVSGRVRASDGSSEALPDLRIFLTKLGGETMGPVKITDKGGFSFPDVGLNEHGKTMFSLDVKNPDGTLRQTRNFEIEYNPDEDVSDINPVMAQPLSVATADGKKLIAPKGVDLPYECDKVTLRIIQRNQLIPVDLYLGNQPITINLQVPGEMPEDGFVRFALRISQDYRLAGTLQVLSSTKNPISPPHDVDVPFPPIEIPEFYELQAQFDKLERKLEDLMEHCNDPARRMLIQGKGQKIAENILRLMGQQVPERQKIKEEICELEALVDPKEEDMKPPVARFRGIIAECRRLVEKAGGDANINAFGPQIDDIEKRGNDAIASKNHRQWGHANDDLMELQRRLESATRSGEPSELPPTPILKMLGLRMIEQEQANLEAQRDRFADHERWDAFIRVNLLNCEADLNSIRKKVEDIPDSMEKHQAAAVLRSDVLTPIERTADRIKNADQVLR